MHVLPNHQMPRSLRRRVYEILAVGSDGDRASQVVDLVLIALVSINVTAVVLESVPTLSMRFGHVFHLIELLSVAVFSVEYLLRVWCAVERDDGARRPIGARLRFMLTPLAVVDLLAIAPFYLSFFIDIDLRFLRAVRLLRVLKLTRYSPSARLLVEVVKDESRNIGAALFVLLLLLVIASGMAYFAEREAQPLAFGSIPAAIWWAITTMTTVGYGDVVPVTVMGRFISGVIGVIGMGMVALPAGILASGFNAALIRRREKYQVLLDQAMSDGRIDDAEAQKLAEYQQFLALSDEDAAAITAAGLKRTGLGVGICPHCDKPLLARRAEDKLEPPRRVTA